MTLVAAQGEANGNLKGDGQEWQEGCKEQQRQGTRRRQWYARALTCQVVSGEICVTWSGMH